MPAREDNKRNNNGWQIDIANKNSFTSSKTMYNIVNGGDGGLMVSCWSVVAVDVVYKAMMMHLVNKLHIPTILTIFSRDLFFRQ